MTRGAKQRMLTLGVRQFYASFEEVKLLTIGKDRYFIKGERYMGRTSVKKKQELAAQEHALQIAQDNVAQIEAAYKQQLENDPEFSLVVDPENKYNMSVTTKEFVRHYIEHRNIATAAVFCHIENDEALEIFTSFPVQQEIRRISRALYHRQFSKKMMSLNEIGGYLTSLIEDSEIPVADRLSTKDKLSVIRMLIELNQMKLASMGDPSVLMMRDVNILVKDLSIGAIKALLEQSKPSVPPNRDLVTATNAKRIQNSEPVLTPEEAAYIESLPADEALALLNEQFE